MRSLALASGKISGADPVEVRDTHLVNGRETFQDPSAPQYISWYARFGEPGQPAANSLFAAHVNYVRHGNGPFAYMTDVVAGDVLTVTLSDGSALSYTVRSVVIHSLATIDMNEVVYPALDSFTERVTLISCGGTFIPAASGVGGEYDSRVVLVAERRVD